MVASRDCFRRCRVFLILGCFFLTGGASVRADWMADVGYTDLYSRLGSAIPTGSGITVTQVEADNDSSTTVVAYKPTSSLSEFSGKSFTFTPSSAAQYLAMFPTSGVTSIANSDHATIVGRLLYGSVSSMSPSVSTIRSWEASYWLNAGLGSQESSDVLNCSWVARSSNITADDATTATKELDRSINQYDYVAVVGADNGGTSPLPYLLAQNYNGITVGLTSGAHSHGLTTIDGTGRMKPDIVAPGTFANSTYTSWATPMVGSAAAMLLQKAKTISTNAARSPTIKAVLMAGATKTEFANWSHSHSSPLDSTFGAGELNVERSYDILTGGEQEASSTISTAGWDYASVASSSGEKFYNFTVAAGQTMSELSALLAWNIAVTSNLDTSLANLDLNLYSVVGATKTRIDYSNSTVDNNIELIYMKNLAAGSYALGVTSSSSVNTGYALAWHMVMVPEPGSFALLVALFASICCYRRMRRVTTTAFSPDRWN